jgi:DNA-directed RNA polymerase subunit E"|tara:strand:+ start:450 stop:638 length:189 start_codon:yes stop_codon:yes gene_type:complete
MVKELACRKCRNITTGRVCPNCGATDLSTDWSGFIVLSTPEKSQVAKQLDITKPGKYAVKVS